MIICFPLLFFGGFHGMAIFPFIFVKYNYLKYDKRVINHEKIHLRQQLELIWILFFVIYFIEYFVNLIRYKDSHKAYMEISFEKEAYANEKNNEYLKNRKFWNFLKYY
ncbi:hypothetical protein O2K51_07540 [Apibacter raozihei]|uniref:hypothetical protein n=1 Tax=Apibacter raozihei TaxID=2500547 RepID=UPI000FE32D97|nr:hypothetical protein [Apibacter raozihei]